MLIVVVAVVVVAVAVIAVAVIVVTNLPRSFLLLRWSSMAKRATL